MPNEQPAKPILRLVVSESDLKPASQSGTSDPTGKVATPATTTATKLHPVEQDNALPRGRERTRIDVSLMDELADLPATAENIMTFEQMAETTDSI